MVGAGSEPFSWLIWLNYYIFIITGWCRAFLDAARWAALVSLSLAVVMGWLVWRGKCVS